jgi:hypothetical protein
MDCYVSENRSHEIMLLIRTIPGCFLGVCGHEIFFPVRFSQKTTVSVRFWFFENADGFGSVLKVIVFHFISHLRGNMITAQYSLLSDSYIMKSTGPFKFVIVTKVVFCIIVVYYVIYAT